MIYTSSTPERDSVRAQVAQLKTTAYARVGKRAFDLMLALLLLPAILPIVIALWLIVSASGGKGIFGHKRVGKDGKVFHCWKLRTMVVDAEKRLAQHLRDNPAAAVEWARDHKLADDPRITAFGQFMRRTSLDELPQIWNVIVGDMSFVGPRPVVRYELHKYGDFRPVYLSMKPGITGLWQVSGRNYLTYGQRVKLDVEYSETMSFLGDVRLIALTGLSVLRATGQ